jgi:hypothetical protein
MLLVADFPPVDYSMYSPVSIEDVERLPSDKIHVNDD